MADAQAGKTYKKLKNTLKANELTRFVHRTMPHNRWLPWGKSDIENMLTESKVSMNVSLEFVQDVMNIYSHIYEEGIKEDAIVSLTSLKEQVIEYAHKNNLDTEKTKNLFKSTLRNYDFLVTMDFDAIDGITVSERTVNFLLFMQDFLEKNGCSSGGQGSGGAGAGAGCGGIKGMVTIESEAKAAITGTPTPIEQMQQQIDNQYAGEKEEDKPKLEEEMTEQMLLTKHLIFTGGASAEIILKNKARDFTSTYKKLSRDAIEILENLSLLSKKTRIQYETKATHIDDPQSKIKKPLLMKSHDEVAKCNLIDHALPTFKHKMATKSLVVNRAVTKHKQKQCLIFLIDASGSMHDDQKQNFVKALLLNRMEAVVKGYAELYIAGFVEHRQTIHKVTNLEECKQYYEKYNDCPGGGVTDIQEVLRETVEDLKKNKLGKFDLESIHPEIAIVNDGQDHIDPEFKPGWKVHAFILGNENKNVKKVVENSGGFYERLF